MSVNPTGPQQDFTLGVQSTGSDIDISVEQTGDDYTADIQVESGRLIPADQVETHFPNSDLPEGNTLRCLEQALLDEAGQGRLTGSSREEALVNLKQGVTGIRGKLLKESGRADSSVVADTHTDPATGKKYYKFLTTWEIDVTIDGEQKTIKKSQWTVTGVEQPQDFSDPEQIRLQQHRAILAVKCHRHLHKAALNPQHKDYTYVKDCIDDLRQTNLVGKQGYTDQNRMMFSNWQLDLTAKGDDRSHQLEDSINQKEAASSLGIRLYNRSGKKVHIYIDQSQEGRKINEAGNKYLKKGLDPEQPDHDYTPLAFKRKEQGDLMVTRGNAEFSKFMKVLHAKPEELEALMEADRFEGKNARGMTFEEVKAERLTARRAQAKIYKRNAKLSGQKFQMTLMQTYVEKAGAGIGLMLRKGLTSDTSFTKHLLEQLEKENLSDEERKRIQNALNEYRDANHVLRDCQHGNTLADHDMSAESVEQNPYLSQEMKEVAQAYLEATKPDAKALSDSGAVKEHQAIIDQAASLTAATA